MFLTAACITAELLKLAVQIQYQVESGANIPLYYGPVQTSKVRNDNEMMPKHSADWTLKLSEFQFFCFSIVFPSDEIFKMVSIPLNIRAFQTRPKTEKEINQMLNRQSRKNKCISELWCISAIIKAHLNVSILKRKCMYC